MLLYDAQQVCNEVTWERNEYKFNPLTLEEAIIPQQSYHVKNAQLILNDLILKREGKSITQIDKKVNKMMNSILENAFLGGHCAKVSKNGLNKVQNFPPLNFEDYSTDSSNTSKRRKT